MNIPETPAHEVVPAANILAQDRLVTAAEVASFLTVSAAWVYENKAALGAIALGTGAKPRVRFDAVTIMAYLARASCSIPRRSEEGETPANKPNPGHRRRAVRAPEDEIVPMRKRFAA